MTAKEEIDAQTQALAEQKQKEAKFEAEFRKKRGKDPESAHGEIRAVLEFLHRDQDITPDYRQDHLAMILNYLHHQQTEELKITLSKLALLVGIDYSHIKRNYVDGLIAFGVLEIAHSKEGQIWTWRGRR